MLAATAKEHMKVWEGQQRDAKKASAPLAKEDEAKVELAKVRSEAKALVVQKTAAAAAAALAVRDQKRAEACLPVSRKRRLLMPADET